MGDYMLSTFKREDLKPLDLSAALEDIAVEPGKLRKVDINLLNRLTKSYDPGSMFNYSGIKEPIIIRATNRQVPVHCTMQEPHAKEMYDTALLNGKLIYGSRPVSGEIKSKRTDVINYLGNKNDLNQKSVLISLDAYMEPNRVGERYLPGVISIE